MAIELDRMLKYFGSVFVPLSIIVLGFHYGYWFIQLSTICGLAIVSWTTAYMIYEHMDSETVSSDRKAVLITGCDSGFGHSLAKRLDRLGYHVFAGVYAYDSDGASKLRKECSKRMNVIKMDVTKAEDVELVVKEIRKQKIPLWAIVNNAGVGISVPFDWGRDVDEYQKLFDVNVFGVVRVTKNCIPLLRESKGRIVNVASVAGRLAAPSLAHYCMSKHSVRVFSDAIRRELNGSGVSVSVIEPTFYKTEILDPKRAEENRKRAFSETPAENRKAYPNNSLEVLEEKLSTKVDRMIRSNVDEVIDAMEKAITRKSPKLYYRCCGYLDVITIFAFSHLPEMLYDYLVLRSLK